MMYVLQRFMITSAAAVGTNGNSKGWSDSWQRLQSLELVRIYYIRKQLTCHRIEVDTSKLLVMSPV
jgi:hypothetical protein